MITYEPVLFTARVGKKSIKRVLGVRVKAAPHGGYVAIQGDHLLVAERRGAMLRGAKVPLLPVMLKYHRKNPGSEMFLSRNKGTHQAEIEGVYGVGVRFHPEVMTPLGFLCDEAITPLIMELNEIGFTTRFSCQGRISEGPWNEPAQDAAYVMFQEQEGANYLVAKVKAAGYEAFQEEGRNTVRFDPAFLSNYDSPGLPPVHGPYRMEL